LFNVFETVLRYLNFQITLYCKL